MAAGVPDIPLDADKRFQLRNVANNEVASKTDLGNFLKALMQKLDADGALNDSDYESLFTP